MEKLLIKFNIFILLVSILFVINCEFFRTYSKDEFMKIGEKKEKENNSSDNKLFIKQEDSYITILNDNYFNFDKVKADLRDQELKFIIFNNNESNLFFTGNLEKIIISGDNLSCFNLKNENFPDYLIAHDSAVFTLQYISNVYSNDNEPDIIKNAIITIPTSIGDFTFYVSCTAKKRKTFTYSLGETNWTPPYKGIADIILVGGGGYSNHVYSDHTVINPGGGGGAGEVLNISEIILENVNCRIIIGEGGKGGRFISDESYHDAQNGTYSYFYYKSEIWTANYGHKGKSGRIGVEGGDGYPDGASGEFFNGGDGGNNGRGYGAGGGKDGYISDGGDAPKYSGGGGGGAKPASQSRGGDGGSGYCEITLTGFEKP